MNARVFVIGATVVAALAGRLSCSAGRGGSVATAVGADSIRIRNALFEEMRTWQADLPAFDLMFDATQLNLGLRIPSRSVPGLEYHWGILH